MGARPRSTVCDAPELHCDCSDVDVSRGDAHHDVVDLVVRCDRRVHLVEVEEDRAGKPSEPLVAVYERVVVDDRVEGAAAFDCRRTRLRRKRWFVVGLRRRGASRGRASGSGRRAERSPERRGRRDRGTRRLPSPPEPLDGVRVRLEDAGRGGDDPVAVISEADVQQLRGVTCVTVCRRDAPRGHACTRVLSTCRCGGGGGGGNRTPVLWLLARPSPSAAGGGSRVVVGTGNSRRPQSTEMSPTEPLTRSEG